MYLWYFKRKRIIQITPHNKRREIFFPPRGDDFSGALKIQIIKIYLALYFICAILLEKISREFDWLFIKFVLAEDKNEGILYSYLPKSTEPKETIMYERENNLLDDGDPSFGLCMKVLSKFHTYVWKINY